MLEKLNSINKLFKKLNKSRLHIDKEIYKKSKYALKLIASKKNKHFLKRSSQKRLVNPIIMGISYAIEERYFNL